MVLNNYKFSVFVLIAISMFCGSVLSQNVNPHILVTNADKKAVLEKIETQAWAKSIYSEMKEKVLPYVDRHQTDPDWILSRYLMNRVPGKRYTQFFADKSGQGLVGYGGDAPVPTIRINTWLRSPITKKGTSYQRPAIEDLVPNDTSRVMLLFNPETNEKEWVDPQGYITSINGDINELAMDAAIVYWLTGEMKYAKFAADILNQWVQGAFYQEPIIGPCRTGFLNMQTLGDAVSRPLILSYDFIKPFMVENGYDLHWYESVFEKIASTLAFRGFWNNNWYAAESSTMVFASLNLENKEKRDYYLQFFLEKDTINGGCGQLALPSTVEKWLTYDGHWKEPGGYHNYPVGNLLISSLALEKNGYDIFQKFPALFRASYAMLKYSFPNLTVGAFGDTGRASQSAESLEIGLIGAIKYGQPELAEMLASMKKLIEGGRYKRENSGFLGLLCFLPEIPYVTSEYQWPRTGTLDFARLFLQRNGTDPETGLMVEVQGATYNHNHCNGMAMELYGCGTVLGIDAGTGPNYEHPMHRNYYSQWAAHNTVVAGGISSSVPYSGSAGSKNIGQIELAAMEPMPDEAAVSEQYSFSDTRYFDKSTNTNQSRTLALVRISEKSGYYVDIFRSDNPDQNDYVYHNIGDKIEFVNEKGEIISSFDNEYPIKDKDYPGFRFYSEVKKLNNYSDNLIARFTAKDEKSKPLYMNAFIAGAGSRDYFQAMSPKTKTSGHQYSGNEQPLFTIHTEKEAKSSPFVVVYEPFRNLESRSIERISLEKVNHTDQFTALNVFCENGISQLILQSVHAEKKFSSPKGTLLGFFGIASFSGEKLSSLYLGKGTEISCSGYTLRSKSANGSANFLVTGKSYSLTCNQPVEVLLPVKQLTKAALVQSGEITDLKFKKAENGFVVLIPQVSDGELIIE